MTEAESEPTRGRTTKFKTGAMSTVGLNLLLKEILLQTCELVGNRFQNHTAVVVMDHELNYSSQVHVW